MAAILEHTVKRCENGKTAKRVLKAVFGISSGLIKELKTSGRIKINGIACRSVDKVSEGDILCAVVEENAAADNIQPYKMDLEILFEDDYIIVINKPGGLCSHPSMNNRESTLANGVMYYRNQNGGHYGYHIVNRLDKDTSGLCVIAKNRYAHSRLSEQIINGTFSRGYTAIVHGVVSPPCGCIEIPIRRESDSVIKRVAAADGKYAKTIYETAAVIGERFSLLDIRLETGRTHQIRVHFSHIGHSLVGDWLYGNGDMERDLILRHALHAGRLTFRHPVTNMKLEFSTELPPDMNKLLLKIENQP